MQRKPNHIPNNSLEEQYFPKDVKLNKGYSRFINCGAYNGDTIKRLNSLVGKIETLVCFEPNRKNFESLSRYLCAEYNKIATEIIALPLGVFNDETQTHFFEAEASSAISDRGDSFIQCVALDHIIPNFQPTFINMDIEGAELKALMGAQKIIKENKPDLAISVYHSPNHIWNIPLYLEELKLGYKFYLRNYTSFTNETILYATA